MKKIIATFLLSSSFVFPAKAAEINGAGASFPYPIYSKWANEYFKQTGNKINYQSIGSGGGIKQIKSKTVTFGATDMPLPDSELSDSGLIQFPTVIGGIVIATNLDISITITPEILTDIFLSKIKKWDDVKIKSLNPGVNLPSLPITPISRSDGSGTTYLFTRYLSSISTEWEKSVGTGTSVELKSSLNAKGNEGVAANIQKIKGSIGYIEYAYAKQNKLNMISLKVNEIVTVSNKSTFQSNQWPITAPTYILMYKKPSDIMLSKQTLNFFDWAYKNGDDIANDLDYIPLSNLDKDKSRSLWLTIQ